MIRINLLPEEFRRKEGASLKVFGATMLGVLLVSGCYGYLAMTWFGDLVEIESRRIILQEDHASMLPQAQYDDRLKTEKKEFEKRDKTIRDIRNKRVLWTLKIDQFVDVVNTSGADERHLTWFDGLEFKASKLGKKSVIGLTLAGHCAGQDIGRVANFFDDVAAHEFWDGIIKINDVSGKQEDPKKDLLPQESVAFPLKMYLAPGATKKKKSKGK